MKIVKNYKEYLDACEEVYNTSEYIWMPKVSYELLTRDELKGLLLNENIDDGTLKLILTEIINNYGKEFYYGKLIGIELTNEDYYYVYERFGKRVYDTCVNGLRK